MLGSGSVLVDTAQYHQNFEVPSDTSNFAITTQNFYRTSFHFNKYSNTFSLFDYHNYNTTNFSLLTIMIDFASSLYILQWTLFIYSRVKPLLKNFFGSYPFKCERGRGSVWGFRSIFSIGWSWTMNFKTQIMTY